MALHFPRPLRILLLLVLVGAVAYGIYEIVRTHAALTEAAAREADLTNKVTTLEGDNLALSDALYNEQKKVQEYEEELDELEEEVDDLEKLTETDPELLAKYSKVYFLNENYTPARLTQIPQEYISNADEEFFHRQAWKYLKDMLEDAKEDGIDITIVSGFRSFDEQAVLKSGYKVTYGYGANAFSADQGYSEHQLATTIDFSTKARAGALEGFQNTEAYGWLVANAHKYGFILSYPSGNSYYQYEPWHWRFVGRKLARDLEEDGKNFYDLDQRDIDKYLISLFD